MKAAALSIALTLLTSCRASLKAEGSASADASGDLKASGSASGETDHSAEMAEAEGSPSEAPGEPGAEAAPLGSGEAALLGARHDLQLSVDRATNQCQCLKVALGDANLPAFRWKAGPPSVDPGSQLVIALSSDGQTCQEPKGSLGASYWGYRLNGNDVLVLVESAGRGRPLTAGGIIPKPFGDGQVYVAPAGKKTPYGRGPDGSPVCKIGNPGAPRGAPLDQSAEPDDTGENTSP